VLRLLVSILLFPSLAGAATPTVAVLPFRDLSGGRGQVGEAIRETVTTDLKEVPGLRVIERAAIDAVIAQQDLQAKRNDLDAVASVRVGTLLGATMLVAGAYQKSGPQVRLTARFVDVATGEVRGSAKVDGAAAELLSLEDRVTGELVRSAGLPARRAPRARPKLRSWKTVELYGDAAVERDPAKKRAILKQALDEDPDFVYAARDLAELDARMSQWSQVASAKMGERERALLREVDDSRRPAAERARTAGMLLGELATARRFHALAEVAARLAESPLPLREEATFRLFQARDRLRKVDLALQTGEVYLSSFPTGPHYREIESRMHELVEARRKRESRVKEWQADVDEKRRDGARGEAYDYAPCIASRWDGQAGARMLDACETYLKQRSSDASAEAREHGVAARFFVVLSLSELGEFDRARPLAEKLIADSDEWDDELRKLMADWPTD
jgi:TolB-like protein